MAAQSHPFAARRQRELRIRSRTDAPNPVPNHPDWIRFSGLWGRTALWRSLGLALLIVSLAVVSSGARAAAPLNAGAACRLARAEKFDNAVYSIFGTYFADGMHGTLLELPGCGQIIFPEMNDGAARAIGAYHEAFARKCRSKLIGDHIVGVFTGTFTRRRARLYGMPAAMMANFFEITDIRSRDLDTASIRCGK